MGNIIQFPEPEHFGDCPKCGRHDGYLNIGRDHWFVCHKHKVKWCVGSNLFSDWREESKETWAQNEKLLAGYGEIEPLDRISKRKSIGHK